MKSTNAERGAPPAPGLDFPSEFKHVIDNPMRTKRPRSGFASAAIIVFAAASASAGQAARPASGTGPSLKILTLNVWSGLDYLGTLSSGDYETPGRRESRTAELLRQVRELDPDVILLQEVNPAGRFARRLASALGYDFVRDIYLSGIKIGPFGIPTNLREGNATLAKPGLGLRKIATWRHSGGFGFSGGFLSFHFDEIVGSLVARITVHGRPLYLVNVHLHASASPDPGLEARFRSLLEDGTQTEASFREGMDSWKAGIVATHQAGSMFPRTNPIAVRSPKAEADACSPQQCL